MKIREQGDKEAEKFRTTMEDLEKPARSKGDYLRMAAHTMLENAKG